MEEPYGALLLGQLPNHKLGPCDLCGNEDVLARLTLESYIGVLVGVATFRWKGWCCYPCGQELVGEHLRRTLVLGWLTLMVVFTIPLTVFNMTRAFRRLSFARKLKESFERSKKQHDGDHI